MPELLIATSLILTAVTLLMVGVYFFFPGVLFGLATRAQRRATGLKPGTATAAGHRMSYWDGGTGEPLVLLHGFGGNKDHWLPIARYLTPYFRVIAPDLAGFGDSTRDPAACYAVSDQVARVHAFVGALGLDVFHLGGNSMGGHIAAAYAARHPQRLAGLWLLAPAGVHTAETSELIECLMRGENPLLMRDLADFDRLMAMCFAHPPYVPGPFKRFFVKRAIRDHEFNKKIFADLLTNPLPLEPVLGTLPVATLIVWGDRDRLLHVSGATILAATLPQATATVMTDCGHVPMVERPREAAEYFLRFSHERTRGDPGRTG